MDKITTHEYWEKYRGQDVLFSQLYSDISSNILKPKITTRFDFYIKKITKSEALLILALCLLKNILKIKDKDNFSIKQLLSMYYNYTDIKELTDLHIFDRLSTELVVQGRKEDILILWKQRIIPLVEEVLSVESKADMSFRSKRKSKKGSKRNKSKNKSKKRSKNKKGSKSKKRSKSKRK